jgi:hypothetical protein
MTQRFTLTRRDEEILTALTLRVRFLSLAQIARTWWSQASQPEAAAQARIKLLRRAGLLQSFHAMAHPELALVAPIILWQPGEAVPNFGAASYQLISRWTQTVIATPSVIATSGAGNRFGGSGGRFPRQSEHTHDLHMGALFLQFRQRFPDLLPYWISEERLREEKPSGESLPDALLRSPERTCVIEFGGAYRKEKLLRFHESCADNFLPYEIW